MMTFNFHGMTFEVSEDSFEGRFAIVSNKVDAFVKAVNSGVAYEELPHAPWDEVHALIDECFYDEHEGIEDEVWRLDGALEYADNKAYKARYMDEFLEYFKDGMPSDEVIENGCLSDWHKGLFGYRPHGDRWSYLVELAKARFEEEEQAQAYFSFCFKYSYLNN